MAVTKLPMLCLCKVDASHALAQQTALIYDMCDVLIAQPNVIQIAVEKPFSRLLNMFHCNIAAAAKSCLGLLFIPKSISASLETSFIAAAHSPGTNSPVSSVSAAHVLFVACSKKRFCASTPHVRRGRVQEIMFAVQSRHSYTIR